MDGLRVIKRSLFVAGVYLGSVITVGVIVAPDDKSEDVPNRPASAGAVTGYSHDQLQVDANMTQQMSAPNANTASQNHRRDGQLARSQNPGYIGALEQHQADIDRMLARGTP